MSYLELRRRVEANTAQQEQDAAPDDISANIRDMIDTFDGPSTFNLSQAICEYVVSTLAPQAEQSSSHAAVNFDDNFKVVP